MEGAKTNSNIGAMEKMKNSTFLGRRFRERLYLLTTFPIAVLAFWVVRTVLFGGGFLPFMVVLLLAVLTFSQRFGAFEIKRTNWATKNTIDSPVGSWFTHGFWTWDGVKERITSVNAWFVIAYVFAAAFFSGLAVVLMVTAWVSFIVLLFATELIGSDVSSWSTSFDFNEPELKGQLGLSLNNGQAQLSFENLKAAGETLPNSLTWNYTSGLTIFIASFFVLLSLLLVPVISRHMQEITLNLLGDSGLADKFSAKLSTWRSKRSSN